MKIRNVLILISIIIILIVSIVYYENHCLPKIERINLAINLGIDNIELYPPLVNFPYSYFRSLLKPGMDREEVHHIIKGHQKVLLCSSRTEMYYFYSTDDEKALRMMVLFDEEEKFKDIWVEDLDSRTFRIENCKEEKIP